MSSFILKPESFENLNGYYKKPECREVVYRLYKRTCQGCRADLSDRSDYVSGHILAVRHAKLFEQLFPGLDVDNLLNLHLLCSACNIRQSAYHFDSPFFLNQVFKEAARAIELRFDKVMQGLAVSPIDTESKRQLEWLAAAEAECRALQAFVRSNKTSEFPLYPEEISRVYALLDEVVRDNTGRICSIAAPQSEAIWLVGKEGEALVGTSLTLQSVSFDGPEIQAISKIFAEGVGCEVALKKPLLTVLRTVLECIKHHRREISTGRPVSWEDTPRSLTYKRLADVRAALFRDAGIALISEYAKSFVLVPIESLNPTERYGWVGWPESEVPQALEKLAQRMGGYTLHQAFGLLRDSAWVLGLQADLRYDKHCAFTNGNLDSHQFLRTDIKEGTWFNAAQIRDVAGIPISTLDRTSQAKLQLVLHLLNLSYGRIEEDGSVFGFYNPEKETFLRRISKQTKTWSLVRKLGKSQRTSGEGIVDLVALEEFVDRLPSLFNALTEDDAWQNSTHTHFPNFLQKRVSDEVMGRLSQRGSGVLTP